MRWRSDDVSVRYDLLFPLYAQLPPRVGYALAARQSSFFARKKQDERAAIRTQMQTCLPEATEAQLDGWLNDYFRMVEQEALDTWYLQHQPIADIVTLQGFEQVQEARAQGKRVLLTGGHFGRFWFAGSAMRTLGHTTGTITRDGGDENIHGLHPAEYRFRLFKLQRLQQALGGPFLVEGNDLRPLYRALDNHLIALIFDVPYTQAHTGSVTVPFFGSTISLPAGIYRIAKKTEAVVAPFYMRDWGNGQVVAEFSALLDPNDYNEQAMMCLLASQLEARIRENPGHWWLWPALPLLQRDNNNESVRLGNTSG
jgi:lauroyl/myristoyl acyltransferase